MDQNPCLVASFYKYGLLYNEADLFNAGIRTAINVGISVSKEGFAAQNSNIKKFSADVKSTIHSLSRLSSIRHSFPFGQILELINLFISKYMSMPSMLYAVS